MAAVRIMIVAITVAAFVGVAIATESPVSITTYSDAFCNTAANTKEYTSGVCAASGDNFAMYSVKDGKVSHCLYASAACDGVAITCADDATETGKCVQTGQGASMMVHFENVAALADISSSSGSGPAPIETVYMYRYSNSSQCYYNGGYRTSYSFRVGSCYAPSQTVRGLYWERIQMQGTDSNARGTIYQYNGNSCTGVSTTTSFTYYSCTYINSRSSMDYSWGNFIDLSGLAAFIIAIIVIGALVVVCSVLTCCCCGAAAAAAVGRIFCCGNRSNSTEYHVRLTA